MYPSAWSSIDSSSAVTAAAAPVSPASSTISGGPSATVAPVTAKPGGAADCAISAINVVVAELVLGLIRVM